LDEEEEKFGLVADDDEDSDESDAGSDGTFSDAIVAGSSCSIVILRYATTNAF